jgi:hypothetical protein
MCNQWDLWCVKLAIDPSRPTSWEHPCLLTHHSHARGRRLGEAPARQEPHHGCASVRSSRLDCQHIECETLKPAYECLWQRVVHEICS